MSITSSSVTTDVSIKSPSFEKKDRIASINVNASNRASADASKVTKNLLAGNNILKDIKKYESKIRARHIHLTMPWGERGSRLLPTSKLMDHKQEIGAMRQILEDKWDKFIQAYPDIKRDAYLHLGTLYDPIDYPTVDEVRAKFSFRLAYNPLPESGDFRIDVPNQEMQELREQYEANMADRISEAMQSAWERVADQVRTMTDKLSITMDDEGKTSDGKSVRYHDTFVKNATDLCDLLAHLNITNDARLDQARLDLRNAVQGVDVNMLKQPTNHNTRANVKAKLDGILSKYAL